MASSKSLSIGVLLEAVQLSDIVGIDIFGNLSKTYLTSVLPMAPTFTGHAEHAMDITIHYISSTLSPASMTAGLTFVPTITYDDCPRDLDIILIGGPLPHHRPAAADKFLREAWERTPVFLTTCIGSLWLASTGVMKGHKATTNRGAIGFAKETYPDVEWLDQRWVIDSKPFVGGEGELWTSGGAGCGKFLNILEGKVN